METKGIKNYPSFYRTFLFPFIRRRISLVTGLDRLPQNGPYIIAANHVGSFDPPMIVATVNQRIKQIVFFVTEQYVIKIFGLQRAVEKLGMIPKIDAKKADCLIPARKHLEEGRVVGIFADGMRNDGPVLSRGRTGVARLTLWTKAPVFPIGFRGPGTWSIRQSMRNIISGMNPPAEIHIGERMSFPEYHDKPITYEMLRDVTDRIMRNISILANKPYPF